MMTLFQKIHLQWQPYQQQTNRTVCSLQCIANLQTIVIWLSMIGDVIPLFAMQSIKKNCLLLGYIPRIIELLLDASNFVMRLLGISQQVGRLYWLDNTLKHLTSQHHRFTIQADKLQAKWMYSSHSTLKPIDNAQRLIPTLSNQVGQITIR